MRQVPARRGVAGRTKKHSASRYRLCIPLLHKRSVCRQMRGAVPLPRCTLFCILTSFCAASAYKRRFFHVQNQATLSGFRRPVPSAPHTGGGGAAHRAEHHAGRAEHPAAAHPPAAHRLRLFNQRHGRHAVRPRGGHDRRRRQRFSGLGGKQRRRCLFPRLHPPFWPA